MVILDGAVKEASDSEMSEHLILWVPSAVMKICIYFKNYTFLSLSSIESSTYLESLGTVQLHKAHSFQLFLLN